jgi:hypothetical protein
MHTCRSTLGCKRLREKLARVLFSDEREREEERERKSTERTDKISEIVQMLLRGKFVNNLPAVQLVHDVAPVTAA